jgi:phosphoribosyl 1,2-cyclic phosphodiesterase
MRIKLWGVRGSLPTPISGKSIENKIREALLRAKPGDIASPESIEEFIMSLPFSIRSTYGGNSTTIEVESDDGEVIIVDCGSGLKNLGSKLMEREFAQGKGVGNILLSHTHWDHIQGIPFFLPFYIKGNQFNFYSPVENLKARLDHQQVFTHFPVTLDYMQASKEFFHIKADSDIYLNDIRIHNRRMPHPGGAYGYRIEEGNKVFVYTSDCEFNINEVENIEKYHDLFINADVAVFDTQYTFEESIDKFEYGHSSASIAIDIAGRFNVKRLVLFHHEPDYDDDKLDQLLLNAKTYLSMNAKRIGHIKVDIAYEGMEMVL